MSADYETKDFKAYGHEDYIYVVRNGDPSDWFNQTDEPFGNFDAESVHQLQSLIDQWKAGKQ